MEDDGGGFGIGGFEVEQMEDSGVTEAEAIIERERRVTVQLASPVFLSVFG